MQTVLLDKHREMAACPFCRLYDFEMQHASGPFVPGEGWKPIAYWIECLSCNALGPPGKTQDQAVTFWNKRIGD